jgi:hypothetical protein
VGFLVEKRTTEYGGKLKKKIRCSSGLYLFLLIPAYFPLTFASHFPPAEVNRLGSRNFVA